MPSLPNPLSNVLTRKDRSKHPMPSNKQWTRKVNPNSLITRLHPQQGLFASPSPTLHNHRANTLQKDVSTRRSSPSTHMSTQITRGKMMAFRFVQTLALVLTTSAFFLPQAPHTYGVKRGGPVFNGDVEVIFPGNKKAKAKPGEALKAVAAKAKFSPNYGCEEGKCGSCELKGSDGKKYRVCITKVPKAAGPLTLKP